MPATRHALIASITQDLLNDLVLFAIGAGVPIDPLQRPVALPGMGEVDLHLALTVTGGSFDLRGDDDGRARVIVNGVGVVSVEASGFTGDQLEGEATGFPSVPAPIPVRVEALVDPALALRDDHTVQVGLDLSRAELVSLLVDPDAPVPDDVDPDTWTSLTQMVQVLFSSMGDDLFASLGEHVGSIGMDLGPDVGLVLSQLGVKYGPAEVRVGSGTMTFALPANGECEGHAHPVPVAGKCVGIGVAASGVDHLGQLLVQRALGGMSLPFELDVELAEQQVGSRLRNARIFDRLPDLRAALRADIRPRLVGGRFELSLQAAWVELPSVAPSFINDLSRRVGGLVSMAPMRLRFPAVIDAPLIPGSDDTIPVRVDDLRVTGDGVGVVLTLD